jgi:hypothetical protein
MITEMLRRSLETTVAFTCEAHIDEDRCRWDAFQSAPRLLHPFVRPPLHAGSHASPNQPFGTIDLREVAVEGPQGHMTGLSCDL